MPHCYIQFYSKWIINLNAKCKTIKSLEENFQGKNCELIVGNIFFKISLKAEFIKEKFYKSDLIKG